MTHDEILDAIENRTDFAIAQITDHRGRISTDQKIEHMCEYLAAVHNLLLLRPPHQPWWQRLVGGR